VTFTLPEWLCALGFSQELIEVDEKLLDGIEVKGIRRQEDGQRSFIGSPAVPRSLRVGSRKPAGLGVRRRGRNIDSVIRMEAMIASDRISA
jgi:hypothetical protein